MRHIRLFDCIFLLSDYQNIEYRTSEQKTISDIGLIPQSKPQSIGLSYIGPGLTKNYRLPSPAPSITILFPLILVKMFTDDIFVYNPPWLLTLFSVLDIHSLKFKILHIYSPVFDCLLCPVQWHVLVPPEHRPYLQLLTPLVHSPSPPPLPLCFSNWR